MVKVRGKPSRDWARQHHKPKRNQAKVWHHLHPKPYLVNQHNLVQNILKNLQNLSKYLQQHNILKPLNTGQSDKNKYGVAT